MSRGTAAIAGIRPAKSEGEIATKGQYCCIKKVACCLFCFSAILELKNKRGK